MCENIENEPIKVRHSKLQKDGDNSRFRVECPVCEEGILLVSRNQKTGDLIHRDKCIGCGQSFIYTDFEEWPEIIYQRSQKLKNKKECR